MRSKITISAFSSSLLILAKVRHEVVAIHPEKKAVTVKNLETGETFEESYDKLLLSPGAKPILPKIEGGKRVFSLRTVEDTFRIKSYIKLIKPPPARIALWGLC